MCTCSPLQSFHSYRYMSLHLRLIFYEFASVYVCHIWVGALRDQKRVLDPL